MILYVVVWVDLRILYVDVTVSLSVGPLQVTPEVRPEVTTLGHPEVIPETIYLRLTVSHPVSNHYKAIG